MFPCAIKGFFSFVAIFYRVVLALRLSGYNVGVLKRTTLPVPVISVGNITLGGAGKTPFVEYIANHIKKRGKKVAVLSRGYGSKKTSVKDGTQGETVTYNDEHLVLCENLTDVPNIINHDRVSGGRRAISEHKVDCLLLDDGFQHVRLDRNLDVVLISAINPFGFGNVIPRGFLREPLKNLKRASVFIITHTNLCERIEIDEIRNKLCELDSSVPIVESIHEPLSFESLSGEIVASDVKWINNRKIYAFCAIGSPGSFSKSLEFLGSDLVGFRSFLDHHFYTCEELEEVVNEAETAGAELIVITQKDKVKIAAILDEEDRKLSKIPFAVLKIGAKIIKNGGCLESMVDRVIS